MEYGKNNRVNLTDTEYKRLVRRYSKELAEEYIILADEIGEARGENIRNPYFFISDMIEKDCIKEQIYAAKLKEMRELEF